MFLTYFENIIYQHTTGTKKIFFAMEIAKKKVKNFQFFLKTENKEKKKFLNPKQEMSGKMLKS